MLACWGLNIVGQTTVLIAFRKAYSVATKSLHTCALAHIKNKSTVGCWGDNKDGQTSVSQHVYRYTNEDDKNTLVNKNAGKGNKDEDKDKDKNEIVKISVGYEISLGVDKEGGMHMWGNKN